MRFPRLIAAAPLGLALILTGCATPPQAESSASQPPTSAPTTASAPTTSASVPAPSTPAVDYKACMVADASGFADGSFNQTSHAGLLRAATELGIDTGEIQSPGEADYAASIQALVTADCDLITLVGFKHADAAQAAAVANPEVQFLLVDAMPATPLPNLKPLLFDPTGAAFLAGYLAAAQTQSGTVATFGAVKNADVVLFLNGFAGGVAHYNQAKGAQVTLLGWDAEKQDGQFIQSQMPFQDVAAGRTTAEALAAGGADIIFPVAGMAGTGALQVAQESGGQVSAIWVDSDGCLSNPNFCPAILTSVYKAMDVAVFDAISDAVAGKFLNTPYRGTLENQGVGLAPFHDFDDKVSPEVRNDLEAVRRGLIDGSITPPAAG